MQPPLQLNEALIKKTSLTEEGLAEALRKQEESGKRVWSGFAQTEVDMSKTESERRERLREIVGRMLVDFPPGSGG